MLAERIFGDAAEERFRGRRRHYVDVGWGDAGKHRQRVVADTGVEVRIMMPRGTFLRDGAVIADDGTQIVVVRRPPEPAVTVRFADHADAAGARRMLLLGYLLGNQHAPIDVDDERLAAPLFISEQAARELLAELGVTGTVGAAVLAAGGWSRTSASVHTHPHTHDPAQAHAHGASPAHAHSASPAHAHGVSPAHAHSASPAHAHP